MADLEKVIKHFQDCIEAAMWNGNHWCFVRVDIISDAVELLKTQEQKRKDEEQ